MARLRWTTTTLWVCAAATAIAGCTTDFDELRDRAWADSSGPPDTISTGDYGAMLTPVETGRRDGVVYVVGSHDELSLSTVQFDVDGVQDAAGVDIMSEGATIEPSALPTVVGSPSAIQAADGLVAMGGLGERAEIVLFDARSGEVGPTRRGVLTPADCGLEELDDFGAAMVFAHTDLGQPDMVDLVVLAEEELIVFVDVRPVVTPWCVHCTLPGERGMAVVATDMGDAGDGEELFVTYGNKDPTTGFSQLAGFPGSQISGAQTRADETCFSGQSPLISLGGPTGDWGLTLAIGEFDGYPIPDLVLGSPLNATVEAMPNFGSSGPTPVELIETPVGSTSFGTTLTTGDFDGDGRDELVVGDPTASPAGADAGGAAYVYAFDTEFSLVGTLHDAQAEDQQRFGRALIAAPFYDRNGVARDVLVVGANDEVFTYFRTPPGEVDARTVEETE